jgi:glutamyl-tRNA synthetase
MRAAAEKEGKPFRYDGRWRDKTEADAPKGVAPAIRLKSPKEGSTIIDDQIQGRIEIPNSEIDDMVILRSDGTPTYMLAVVVDDHDMEITHVIRGVDHLTNAARQAAIYKAMGWELPIFAHVPLIHGPDGAKLSKRHGALGVDAYEEMGYLPEAMCNYLARLGWSHGDDEIFSREKATEWFSLSHIGKSPARFDFDKLANLNGHYIRDCDNARLVNLITPQLGKNVGEIEKNRIFAGMNGLKERAKTLPELAKSAAFYISRPPLDEKAKALLNPAALELIKELIPILSAHEAWDQASLEARIKQFAETKAIKLGNVAQPLRAAITGSSSSPGMFEVMAILGKDETIARLSSIS